MEKACLNPDCTVAQTGICLLNNDPLTCPKRSETDSINVDAFTAPVLEQPVTKAKFPSSLSLSPDDTHQLMSARYCHMVGILGSPDSGKTASLVSIYLLLAHNKLDGFEFRDSQSIRAFEEISRGARRWNDGQPPEQMTSHTDIGEGRAAGFLHLRLLDTVTDEPVDILLPDLPGEWSNSLIDSNRRDRLDFLKSTDSIWLMVDGKSLIQRETRQQALHRTKLLLQRIAEFLKPRIPPVTLVITRRDSGVPQELTIESIRQEAVRHNITIKVAYIASFSTTETVPPGAGVADLISSTVREKKFKGPMFWPDSSVNANGRYMLRFCNRGEQS